MMGNGDKMMKISRIERVSILMKTLKYNFLTRKDCSKINREILRKNLKREYEVEEILGIELGKNGKKYKIKWVGYPSKFNSWEPEENIVKCNKAIRVFMHKINMK